MTNQTVVRDAAWPESDVDTPYGVVRVVATINEKTGREEVWADARYDLPLVVNRVRYWFSSMLEPIAERYEESTGCGLYGTDNYGQGRRGSVVNDSWATHYGNRSWRRTDHKTSTEASWRASHDVERLVADWLATAEGRELVEAARPVYQKRQQAEALRAYEAARGAFKAAAARLDELGVAPPS